MKLIYCMKCDDVVRLIQESYRYCQCHESYGKYLDPLLAEVHGPCVPIGLKNSDVIEAAAIYNVSGRGVDIAAFTIPLETDSLIHVDGAHEIKKDYADKLLGFERALDKIFGGRESS